MSLIRTAAGATATTVAVLALAAGSASARPDYQVDTGPFVPATPETTTPVASPTIVERGGTGDGLDTLAVLAVAGGTLLVGAAGGVGGSRVMARRHLARS